MKASIAGICDLLETDPMVQRMGVFHEELTQTPKPCPVATCRELLAC